MKVFKKALSFILVVALVLALPVQLPSAKATTSELQTTVNGSISVTVLDISIPTALAFSIDPNVEGVTYTASVATIVNDTNAPIKVLINPGNNFRQDPESLWKPVDYLPEDKEWDKLGTKDSQESLALGIIMVDKTQWRRVDREEPLYVKQQQAMTEPVSFGEIDTKESVEMTFTINHGFSFKESKTCIYNVVWYFTLAD